MLTQSEHALSGLEPALVALGHEVMRWPLIRTVPVSDPGTRARVAAMAACRWLLFTSIAAVEAWAALDSGSHAGRLFGAVGPGTAAALRAAQVTPTLVAGGDARSLAAAFLAHPLATGPIGLPLGDRAATTLRDALEHGGHEVVTAVVYRTETLPPPELTAPAGRPDAVVLASPSAVSALPAAIASESALVAIGETTAAAVRATGRSCRRASEPTVAGVVECLLAAQRTLMESDA